MIVYGGASVEGSAPADKQLYELRFDPSHPTQGTWSVMAETTLTPFSSAVGPAPRYWHAMAVSNYFKNTLVTGGPPCAMAYLFGGALGGGAYSDTLWMLALLQTGKYAWG